MTTRASLDPEALIALAERAGLATPAHRARLVAALDPALVARLPIHNRPAEQLASDLAALCRLADPTPLAAWLRAARHAATPEHQRELAALRRALIGLPAPQAPTPLRPALVLIRAGRSIRGSFADEIGHFADEAPAHVIELTRPLLMAATPVTRAQYHALINRRDDGPADAPMTGVRWRDAVVWCNRLSTHEGLEAAYAITREHVALDRDADGYRLPTEAEWEHACRAETLTRFWSGDTDDDARRVGDFGDGAALPGPVGRRAANPWGLYDLHGGVWEWCTDGEAPYGPDEPQRDPLGPLDGPDRIVRGGSVRDPVRYARSACRVSREVGRRADDMGFRIVRLA